MMSGVETSITSQVLLLLLPGSHTLRTTTWQDTEIIGIGSKEGSIDLEDDECMQLILFLKSDYLFFQGLKQPQILQDATFFLTVVLQSLSHVQLSVTLYTATC